MAESDKFIMLNMDDPNLKKVSEVLTNKTSMKIVDYLSENKEASEKDLSDKLDIPLNTVEYNIKKLVESGIVKKHKDFFWSKKGKKIVLYELSKKSIVISPRGSNFAEKLKSLVPAFFIIGAGSFATYVYEKIIFGKQNAASVAEEGVSLAADSKEILAYEAPRVVGETSSNLAGSPLWMWFFLGGLIALAVFALVNWRKL